MRSQMGVPLLFATVSLAFAVEPVGAQQTPAPTRDQASLTCTSAATKTVVRAFVHDFARGRTAAIARLWAPAPRFKWFSTGPPGARLGAGAYDRATLGAYFRGRIRVHEKLGLVRIGAGYDGTRGIVNFAGRLVRSADDIAARPPQDFKGAADCLSGRPLLIVWSM
jgi:hypothetical protein